jgi:ParB-like chromosome segregation protein Spo0J
VSQSRPQLEYGVYRLDAVSPGSGQISTSGRAAAVEIVPIDALTRGESPRLNGQDAEHAARLAQSEGPLPPILVDRRGMRVIDGMHRLIAARLRGQTTIEVQFFDGSEADAFLTAVEANVAHGLPLTLADRRAAARRIIRTHPQMSDRAVATVTGLGRTTVASLRTPADPADDTAGAAGACRIGKDGKVRPLNGAEGRARAAAYLEENPQASLREVALEVGVSPGTVSDVRKRLERGEAPLAQASLAKAAAESDDECEESDGGQEWSLGKTRRRRNLQNPADPEVVLRKLMRDPSLRYSNAGRQLLKLLCTNAEIARARRDLMDSVPSHCKVLVSELAEHYGVMWRELAQELSRIKH